MARNPLTWCAAHWKSDPALTALLICRVRDGHFIAAGIEAGAAAGTALGQFCERGFELLQSGAGKIDAQPMRARREVAVFGFDRLDQRIDMSRIARRRDADENSCQHRIIGIFCQCHGEHRIVGFDLIVLRLLHQHRPGQIERTGHLVSLGLDLLLMSARIIKPAG